MDDFLAGLVGAIVGIFLPQRRARGKVAKESRAARRSRRRLERGD